MKRLRSVIALLAITTTLSAEMHAQSNIEPLKVIKSKPISSKSVSNWLLLKENSKSPKILSAESRATSKKTHGTELEVEILKKNFSNSMTLKPVFTPSETETLNSIGAAELSKSWVLSSTEGQVKSIKEFISAKNLGLRIEKRSVGALLSNSETSNPEPFEYLQWALRNSGSPQPVHVSSDRDILLNGVNGEDISERKIPSENPNRKIKVAVIDSGIDTRIALKENADGKLEATRESHPEFLKNLRTKPKECESLKKYKICLEELPVSNCKSKACEKKERKTQCDSKFLSIDHDSNGYPMDCLGWNALEGKPDGIEDNMGHGTHVSGIIGAGKNNQGIRGVTQNVEIIPIKVLKLLPQDPNNPALLSLSSPSNLPTPDSLGKSELLADVIAKGILYALSEKAEVINISIGWPLAADSLLLRKIIKLAGEQNPQPIIVASAGNDSSDALLAPCIYSEVLCVGAFDSEGKIAHFSNYGTGVDILAPGLNILSSYPMSIFPNYFTVGYGWEYKSGTSMSAPFVSGALARLLNAGFKRDEAIARLLSSTRKTLGISSLQKGNGFYKFTNGGNLDLNRSFNQKPRPWLVAPKKSPIRISWDGSSRGLEFKMGLKNTWEKARNIKIKGKVKFKDGKDAQEVFEMSNSSWSMQKLDNLESVNIKNSIEFKSTPFPSEFLIELEVNYESDYSSSTNNSQTYTQNLTYQIEVVRSFSPDNLALLPKGVEVLPIQDHDSLISDLEKNGWDTDFQLRSIHTLPHESGFRDFLALLKSNKYPSKRKYLLFKFNGSEYETQSSDEFEISSCKSREGGKNSTADCENLSLLQKIDLDGDAKLDYVFIHRKRIPGVNLPRVIFRIFDENLKKKPFWNKSNTIEYSNDPVLLTGDFKWLSLTGKLTPTWISKGRPINKNQTIDPWDLIRDESERKLDEFKSIRNRLFSLTEDGLIEIPTEDDRKIITLLNSDDPRKVTALFSTDHTYFNEYYVGKISKKGNTDFRTFTKIDFKKFQNLEYIRSHEAFDLTGTQSTSTFFSGKSGEFSLKYSLIDSNSNDFITPVKVDSLSPVDPLSSIRGLFLGKNGESIFSLSRYSIYFHDSETGKTAHTPLKRYTFFGDKLFDDLHFPVKVKINGVLSSGLYLPGGVGNSPNPQIVVPIKSKSGNLKLIRPAELKLTSRSDCQTLDDPLSLKTASEDWIAFKCASKILWIPLTLE